MPKPLMQSSTPKLSEVARHVVIPEGIVTTVWPRVVAQCADMGVVFDRWQHGIGTVALGKRADGKYAATVGGIVLSIPRQVGKTFLVGMIIIALCVLFPGLTVLWSAHRTRTATKTFASLKGMTSRKKIAPHMLDPRNTNGEQELRFKNGSVVMFGAREQGFGRGFDEVDIEVFDEGQILTEKALEDMVPAANQSRHEAGALLFFMGTPPRPSDPGEEFTNRRNKALAGKPEGQVQVVAGNMVYVEFSADDTADPDDRRQWSKANPSFPLRTPVESMERMREQLTDVDSFRREGLGIWDDKDGGEFSAKTWRDAGLVLDGKLQNTVVALDVRMGLEQSVSLGVVGSTGQGVVGLVGKYEHGRGKQWSDAQIVGWVAGELELRGVDSVAVDEYGQNGPLIPLLEAEGLTVLRLRTGDMRNACMGYAGAVVNGQVHHVNDDPLNLAVLGARRRKSNEGWLWSRTNSVTDVGPLMAVAAAWWVHQSGEPDYDLSSSFY